MMTQPKGSLYQQNAKFVSFKALAEQGGQGFVYVLTVERSKFIDDAQKTVEEKFLVKIPQNFEDTLSINSAINEAEKLTEFNKTTKNIAPALFDSFTPQQIGMTVPLIQKYNEETNQQDTLDYNDKTCIIVSEFIEGESLDKKIQDDTLTFEEMLQIHDQLFYLLSKMGNYVHLDIKPANIMVTEKNGALVLRLIDLGSMKRVGEIDNVATTPLFDPRIWALLNEKQTIGYDQSIDAFSILAIIYQMWTKNPLLTHEGYKKITNINSPTFVKRALFYSYVKKLQEFFKPNSIKTKLSEESIFTKISNLGFGGIIKRAKLKEKIVNDWQSIMQSTINVLQKGDQFAITTNPVLEEMSTQDRITQAKTRSATIQTRIQERQQESFWSGVKNFFTIKQPSRSQQEIKQEEEEPQRRPFITIEGTTQPAQLTPIVIATQEGLPSLMTQEHQELLLAKNARTKQDSEGITGQMANTGVEQQNLEKSEQQSFNLTESNPFDFFGNELDVNKKDFSLFGEAQPIGDAMDFRESESKKNIPTKAADQPIQIDDAVEEYEEEPVLAQDSSSDIHTAEDYAKFLEDVDASLISDSSSVEIVIEDKTATDEELRKLGEEFSPTKEQEDIAEEVVAFFRSQDESQMLDIPITETLDFPSINILNALFGTQESTQQKLPLSQLIAYTKARSKNTGDENAEFEKLRTILTQAKRFDLLQQEGKQEILANIMTGLLENGFNEYAKQLLTNIDAQNNSFIINIPVSSLFTHLSVENLISLANYLPDTLNIHPIQHLFTRKQLELQPYPNVDAKLTLANTLSTSQQTTYLRILTNTIYAQRNTLNQDQIEHLITLMNAKTQEENIQVLKDLLSKLLAPSQELIPSEELELTLLNSGLNKQQTAQIIIQRMRDEMTNPTNISISPAQKMDFNHSTARLKAYLSSNITKISEATLSKFITFFQDDTANDELVFLLNMNLLTRKISQQRVDPTAIGTLLFSLNQKQHFIRNLSQQSKDALISLVINSLYQGYRTQDEPTKRELLSFGINLFKQLTDNQITTNLSEQQNQNLIDTLYVAGIQLLLMLNPQITNRTKLTHNINLLTSAFNSLLSIVSLDPNNTFIPDITQRISTELDTLITLEKTQMKKPSELQDTFPFFLSSIKNIDTARKDWNINIKGLERTSPLLFLFNKIAFFNKQLQQNQQLRQKEHSEKLLKLAI